MAKPSEHGETARIEKLVALPVQWLRPSALENAGHGIDPGWGAKIPCVL